MPLYVSVDVVRLIWDMHWSLGSGRMSLGEDKNVNLSRITFNKFFIFDLNDCMY
jgi:hypothetical protein